MEGRAAGTESLFMLVEIGIDFIKGGKQIKGIQEEEG